MMRMRVIVLDNKTICPSLKAGSTKDGCERNKRNPAGRYRRGLKLHFLPLLDRFQDIL